MRARLILMAIGLAAAISGCVSHPSAVNTAPPPVAQGGQAGVGDEQFVPPTDAQWTIACVQFKGYGHVEQAKSLRQLLTAKTGLPAFYVVHEADVSTLYYGFYREFRPSVDAVEGARAQADKETLRKLQNGVGDQLFPYCRIAPLEPPDPVAPTDWNLLNVDRGKADGDPTKGYWTLEIAVYKDNPQRKQAAVDTVRAMREQLGLKNIYFYHGKTCSSVCVGTWPLDAVQQIQPERGNPDDRLVVMADGTPAGFSGKVKDREGVTVRPVDLKSIPVDPTLIDMQSKFDRRSVNGYDIKHTYNLKAGGTIDIYDPSQIVYIPRDESPGGLLGGSDQASTTVDPTGGTPDMSGAAGTAMPSNTDGGARLRSLNNP